MPKIRETKIENGVQVWPCTKCGKWLPREQFYTDVRLKDGRFGGLRGPCKECYKGWHQKVYMQRLEVQTKERARSLVRGKTLEAKCRNIVSEAIQSGKLVRPNFCPVCGVSNKEKRIEAHHDDYFRPLEVKWMCSQCHTDYHKERLL
jgi:hypothetical protein